MPANTRKRWLPWCTGTSRRGRRASSGLHRPSKRDPGSRGRSSLTSCWWRRCKSSPKRAKTLPHGRHSTILKAEPRLLSRAWSTRIRVHLALDDGRNRCSFWSAWDCAEATCDEYISYGSDELLKRSLHPYTMWVASWRCRVHKIHSCIIL